MSKRREARQRWYSGWREYTHPNAHGKTRPQSSRQVRRQYWRDEWKERKQGASTEGEIT